MRESGLLWSHLVGWEDLLVPVMVDAGASGLDLDEGWPSWRASPPTRPLLEVGGSVPAPRGSIAGLEDTGSRDPSVVRSTVLSWQPESI